ncbi:MAG: hypothetical protein HXK19_05760 [Alloprevotella tannerae]|uniref:Uncharacterized protein n=1 Tax=Alloprevotella tannerae ATCC 51259 TaxID=626522 RepID=C9LD09_9BACT|nr:hypothetical protein GCWU000325_00131 [Alloprevotella tannerae ATCC 51259]MBF0957374.1 hypothetical protein [Alloprevotella tannerae]
MKTFFSIILSLLIGFLMVFSLIFCFDAPSLWTNIQLLIAWAVFWGFIIYILKRMNRL